MHIMLCAKSNLVHVSVVFDDGAVSASIRDPTSFLVYSHDGRL